MFISGGLYPPLIYMNWKTVKLGEILNFRRGHDLPHSEMKQGDIPVAGSNGCIGFHNVATPIAPIITIGRSGNIGTPYYYEKAWAHNTTLYIDDFKGNNPKYLYYLLKTLPLSAYTGGSAVPTLNRNHIHPLEILHIEDKATQDKIVAILSSLDDKIENNNRINRNLEAQAQALFKSWFVDFEPFGGKMPEDWKEGKLTEVANYLNGLAMQKFPATDIENSLPVLKIKELGQRHCDKTSDRCTKEIKPEYIIHDGDVIFSWSGTLLVDIWCGGDCGLNQHLFKVTSEKYPKWFYYLWTVQHLQNFKRIASDKAVTMGHIKRGDLDKSVVLIPNDKELNKMTDIMAPILDSIISNALESARLAALRDTLLPKLMKGEIEV